MPARKGLLAPQNTFLDTIATRFDGTHSNFVLGNAKIAKIFPIVYCSDGFCDLSGYSRAQIMQKSCACNFLYGQKTDHQHRQSISRALEQKKELKLEVILYKSSGTPFWCLLDIVPIQDEKHEVVLFLCSHKDITKQKLHEQQQHQLAQLHAQKQQQLLSSAAAAAAAASDNSLTSPSEQQSGHNNFSNNHNLQEQQQQQVATNDTDHGDSAQVIGRSRLGGAPEPDTQKTDNWEQQQRQNRKLEDADEAELTAMANQNALLSMDEFGLQDDLGGEGADFEEGNSDSGDDHDKHTANQYSRRRSRAVLYQLSGHYGYRRNVNMKSKLKLNNRMNIPEYKTTTIEKQKFILSHYGVGKSCWDWLILVVSFYVAIVVPYNATFKDKQEDLMGECKIDSIDILVEFVFLIDVVLNFRTTFVNRKGEVVTRPEIIYKHYVRGWFVVDACAALPFDLLCNLNLYSRSRLDLNLLKLIRLLRLARLLQKMDRYSQYSYIILTLLMLIFSLLAHWCACIWYVIAMEEIAQNPSDWKIGWLHQLSDKLGRNVVNATDMAASYVTALYFTTSSLTSVGFGNVSANTNAEKIFSIVIMLIGALMHAVVFGNVTALIRVMYARRSNYQTRLRDLKDFFRLHQLPKELQQRMSDYFQTTWSLNHGIETYEILKDFPEELRGDVSLHLHREVLSLPIFETAPQGFLKSLARHIESKFCCPTEYLIHRGDALNYLYLVCNGSMEVLQDNMVVAILGKGDLVGYDVNAMSSTPERTQFGGLGVGGRQAGLMKQSQQTGSLMTSKLVKSSSDLKALTYCDLKCIHIAGLLEVLKLYPEFSDTFHREIIHDLSFNLRENHDLEHENIMMGGHDDDDDDDDDDDADGGDDNDADEDDDDGRDDADAGQQPSGNRSNMNQLFRSIKQQQSHQIGRYDYVDDEENEDVRQGHDDDELISDEQENDDDVDDEEEEEDEEEEGNEPDGEEREDNDNDNDGENDDRGPGVGDQAAAPGEQSEKTNGGNSGDRTSSSSSSNNKRKPEETSRQAESSDRAEVGGRSNGDQPKDGGQVRTETATNRLQENPRRRRMRVVADGDGNSKEATDNVSWHSECDGLSSPKGAQLVGNSRQAKTATMMSKRNNSHEPATDTAIGDRNSPANRQPPRPIVGGRLKLSSSRQESATLRDRKPPIMFDLSRNTTVIVDRRRRSAGCIRPLLIGPAAVGRQTNYSSLTHISENPASDSGLNHSRPNHRRANNQKGMASESARTREGGTKMAGTYSSQDLKGLDTRINCLSTGVRELKQELQQELNQMRGTMQLFVRMAEQQQRQQLLLRRSSGSLGQISTSTVPASKVRASGNARGRRTLADPRNPPSPLMMGGARSGLGLGLVHRSQSASSLPAVRLIAGNRQAGILHEESDDLDEAQSIASEPAAPVATSMSLDSPDHQQKSAPMTLAAAATATSSIAASNSNRAISQCSSTLVSPLPQTPSNLSQQQMQMPFAANFLQTTTCNHSDNDSGRSSTSMNSSSQQPSANRQVLVVQSQPVATVQTDPVQASGSARLIKISHNSHQASANLEDNANRSARFATKVLFTGIEGQRQASGKQYATITADGHSSCETATTSKSSLV